MSNSGPTKDYICIPSGLRPRTHVLHLLVIKARVLGLRIFLSHFYLPIISWNSSAPFRSTQQEITPSVFGGLQRLLQTLQKLEHFWGNPLPERTDTSNRGSLRRGDRYFLFGNMKNESGAPACGIWFQGRHRGDYFFYPLSTHPSVLRICSPLSTKPEFYIY